MQATTQARIHWGMCTCTDANIAWPCERAPSSFPPSSVVARDVGRVVGAWNVEGRLWVDGRPTASSLCSRKASQALAVNLNAAKGLQEVALSELRSPPTFAALSGYLPLGDRSLQTPKWPSDSRMFCCCTVWALHSSKRYELWVPVSCSHSWAPCMRILHIDELRRRRGAAFFMCLAGYLTIAPIWRYFLIRTHMYVCLFVCAHDRAGVSE